MQICNKCSANEQAVQSFCPICGKRLILEGQCAQAPRKRLGFAFIKEIIKKSVVLAISIFMLFAAFLPIFKYSIDFETRNEEAEIRFNAVDAIVFYIASFKNLDDEDFAEEMEEFLEDAEDKYDDFEDWQKGKNLDSLGKFMKRYLRFSLRSNASDASATGFLCALTALVYITVAILLTVFSALSFASLFTGKVKDKSRFSTSLLALQPLLAIVFAIIYKLEYGAGSLTIYSAMSMKTETSDVQMAVISLGILGIAMLAVFRIFFEEKPKIKAGVIVKYALSCTFAILLMVSVCLPIIKTNTKAHFSDSGYDYTGYPNYEYVYEYDKASGKIGNGIFSSLDFSAATKESLDNMSDEEIEEMTIATESSFNMITKRSYKNGEGEMVDHSVFSAMLLNFGGYQYSAVFVAGTVAVFLVLVCAGLILWQNARAIALGKAACKKLIIPAKIIAIAMAVVVLALTIVMCIVVTANAKALTNELDSDFSYRASIGVGSIMMLACAIGCACIPAVKKPKLEAETQACDCTAAQELSEAEAPQDTASNNE